MTLMLLWSATAPALAAGGGNVMFGSQKKKKEETKTEETLLTVKVGNLELAMDEKGGSIRVSNGTDIYQMPVVTEKDTLGNSYLSNYIPAPFSYETARLSGTSLSIAPNYFNSKSDKAEVTKRNDGFDVTYNLVSREIRLTIHYTLTNDSLIISIPWKEINEYGEKYKLTSISLMPYFQAAVDTDSGYILYPDGCGAISRFTDDHPSYNEAYDGTVYGDAVPHMDATIYDNNKEILLPVFGVLKNGTAMVAWIDEGAENAHILYEPSGYQMNLARIYPKMIYRSSYQAGLDNGTMAAKVPETFTQRDFTVTYHFLKKNSDYADMAAAYREHLQAKGILPASGNADAFLSMELFMGVLTEGALFDEYIPMTTFRQAITVLSECQEQADIPMRTTLLGWTRQGFGNAPVNLSPASRLGGKKEYQILLTWCHENNIPLMLEADLISALKSGENFSQNSIVHQYNKISPVTNLTEDAYLFSPIHIRNVSAPDLAKKAVSLHADGVMLQRFGESLYADNSRIHGLSTRNDTAVIRQQVISELQKNDLTVAASGGSLYTLSEADWICNVPVEDSGYYFRSEVVPFWQIVVHGALSYTSEPANLWFDTNEALLKMIEYGCMPSFRLTHQPSVEMIDAENISLFSSEYRLYLDAVKRASDAWKNVIEPFAGTEIVDHSRLSDQVYCTEYANGARVYVNYGAEPAHINCIEIPAMGYALINP